jgi:hypothetical protein
MGVPGCPTSVVDVNELEEEEEEDVEDLDEDLEGFKGMVGIPKLAVELTLSEGRMPSLSPSSSSRLKGARVQAAPDLVLVRFVVVVPKIPQPVNVALYSSEQVVEVAEAEDEVGSKSVQVLKTSVTVVFWFSSQLLRFGGSPVLGPQPSGLVHLGPLHI